jgi:tetratricopeptide (TPR) repeat protein
MKTHITKFIFSLILLGTSSCTKEFLDEKPTRSAIVPTKLADYRSLLDNPSVMMQNSTPAMGLLSSDDFIIPDNLTRTLPATERGAYLWEKEMPSSAGDWFFPYVQVLYCNVVLDGTTDLSPAEKQSTEYSAVQGTALFLRAFAFFNLLETFSKPYNPATAQTDPGIPIRLSSDVNVRPGRGTVQQGYDQVIADLKNSAELLPLTEQFKNRPTKAAAFAMLARVNLIMGNFAEAGNYANESLKLNSSLLDYRTLNKNAARPFPLALPNGNTEILFYGSLLSTVFSTSALTSVSQELYTQYQIGDLRKNLFFDDKGNGTVNFKGTYSGDTFFFSGLSTGEQYLVRAECYARAGHVDLAIADLNALLIKRWDASFQSIQAFSPSDAVQLILQERRKELIGSGLRFSDLRRLNQDPKFAVTLKRTFDGKEYSITPGDTRYIFLIPDQEITLTGIQQNTR